MRYYRLSNQFQCALITTMEMIVTPRVDTVKIMMCVTR